MRTSPGPRTYRAPSAGRTRHSTESLRAAREGADMQLELTADQEALREELRTYFDNLMTDEERDLLLVERHGEVYRDVVKRMGRDGWMGVGWPKEYGGRGFGEIEQQIFANEASRADVPLPSVTLQTVGPT